MQARPSLKPRSEALNPWKLSQPATLPWPSDESDEVEAVQESGDRGLSEFLRAINRRDQHGQPIQEIQDPVEGWESGYYALGYQ